jgi:tetratricopeptide (TPR) repeat protein
MNDNVASQEGQADRIRTNSPSFEYVYVANQRCPCGGYFNVTRQELLNTPAGPVDRLLAECKQCDTERAFEFDISSFFGDFDKYAHFFPVDKSFRAAMEHIQAGRLAQAESLLRQVVDPQTGEPAFAWGHYHLGQVLLTKDRPTEGLEHLQRAAEIQPLEPNIHRALGKAYQALDREDEAQEHLRRAEELL